MPLFTLQLIVDGEVQVLSVLSRWEEHTKDMREPYLEITDDFKAELMPQVFANEGPGWAPLSLDYAKYKMRVWPGTGILVRTGELADSLMGGAGYVQEIGPDTLVVGTNVPYAKFHQRGTAYMPMRKIIDIPQDARWRWVKIVQRFLVAKAREAGLKATGGDS